MTKSDEIPHSVEYLYCHMYNVYPIYSVIRQEFTFPKLLQICESVFVLFSYKIRFSFQNNLRDVDQSYIKDLDL